ncbi:hypothetical protein GPECTOR_51g707 [Gonium pectorale]|uniref:Kinesin light chain n=1 Tax=Gonium pectorale TaxID=33097 RepID=A0A150G7C5_GONPE|nr:hypothetical protein GPECTOR_51g707 [Gonium pectorale]|eukprot:KXZ45721.1 hypothetical protein GPECTOR_51g707 [Gonium pectorale]
MCADCEHPAAGLRAAAAELRHALAGGAVAQVPGPEEEWTEATRMQALEAAERSLGASHRETLSTVGKLVALQRSRGRYAEAEELCRRALEGREQTLGPEHPDTFATVDTLAGILRTQGKKDEAASLYARLLSGCDRTLGPSHAQTLAACRSLAAVLESLGRIEEAAALTRRALQGSSQATAGADVVSTLADISNLAGLMLQHSEAERLLRRALDGYGRSLGPNHPETLSCLANLACCLEAQGRLPEAEAAARRVLEGRRQALGRGHASTLASLQYLANLLGPQGRHGEAEGLLRRALEGFEQTLGRSHPITRDCLGNLAAALEAQEQLDEAEALTRRVLELTRQALGAAADDTLIAQTNLAGILAKRGALRGAEVAFREALAVLHDTHGPAHADTQACLRGLARVLMVQGRSSELGLIKAQLVEGGGSPLALECISEEGGNGEETTRAGTAARASERVGAGPGVPQVGTAADGGQSAAAGAATGAEEAEVAEEVGEAACRAAVEEAERREGPEHPATLAALQRLAAALEARAADDGGGGGGGREEEAERLLRRVMEVRRKALGDYHPETLATVNRLASLLLRRDKCSAEAGSLLKRALWAVEIEDPSLSEDGGGEAFGKGRGNSINHLQHRAQPHGATRASGSGSGGKSGGGGGRTAALRGLLSLASGLAASLASQGAHERAEGVLRAALVGYERSYGSAHVETLGCVGCLAAALVAQQPPDPVKLDEAERLYRRQLDGYPQLLECLGSLGKELGGFHPAMLDAASRFAQLLQSRGKYREAERLYKTVLEGRGRVLGTRHPDTLGALRALTEVRELSFRRGVSRRITRGESLGASRRQRELVLSSESGVDAAAAAGDGGGGSGLAVSVRHLEAGNLRVVKSATGVVGTAAPVAGGAAAPGAGGAIRAVVISAAGSGRVLSAAGSNRWVSGATPTITVSGADSSRFISGSGVMPAVVGEHGEGSIHNGKCGGEADLRWQQRAKSGHRVHMLVNASDASQLDSSEAKAVVVRAASSRQASAVGLGKPVGFARLPPAVATSVVSVSAASTTPPTADCERRTVGRLAALLDLLLCGCHAGRVRAEF